MAAHKLTVLLGLFIVGVNSVVVKHQKLSTPSPIFPFKEEFENVATYIAFAGENPVYRCFHGDRVYVNTDNKYMVQTSIGQTVVRIVNNSILNTAYEGKFEIVKNNTFLDVIDKNPVNNSYFTCTNFGTSSLAVRVVPLLYSIKITSENKGIWFFETYCHVEVSLEGSCLSITPFSRKVLNDTHCLMSFSFECNLDEPCFINATVGLANESNVETRHLQFDTVCKSLDKESTTEIMTNVTIDGGGSNKQENFTNTASKGKSQVSPAVWVSIVAAGAVLVLLGLIYIFWRCRHSQRHDNKLSYDCKEQSVNMDLLSSPKLTE